MSKFNKIRTPIEDLFIIEPTVFEDNRGYFFESYNKKEFYNLGITKEFIQDNHSKSVKGVLRGLHFQIERPQSKLVSVIKGSIFDVAVDLRWGSPHFRKYFGTELSERNKRMIYIPEGFAHGFLSLAEEVDIEYKVTDYYNAEYDHGIIWNDPDILIRWPLKEYGMIKPILSEKDARLPKLKEIETPFSYSEKF